MEFSDHSNTADAFVALIQKQMRVMSEGLSAGQRLEVIVPVGSNEQINATWFGHHNPDIVKITGVDAAGNDVCLFAHKTTLQVLMKKITTHQQEGKLEDFFQNPASTQPGEIVIDETA